MKKKIALVLTMAMLGSCLAGCGQNADDNGAASDQKDSTTVAQSTETAQGTEAGEKEWFGTDDGKTVTIRLWGGVQPEYGYDEVCANFNEEYKDKGVQVEYVRYVNDSSGNLQLETYLMAGEDGGVDVFIGYGSKNALATRADGGLLYDYSDYLDSIGFDIGKELGENTKANYVFDNGEVWGLPTKFDNNAYLMG